MGGRTVTIDLSLEELWVLSGPTAAPPWVDLSPISGAPEPIQDAIRGVAWRSLRVRKMADEHEAASPPIRQLIDLLTRPEVVIEFDSPGPPRPARVIVASPTIAVDHRQEPNLIHRLVAFPTEDLRAQISAVTGLGDQPAASGDRFEVDQHALTSAADPELDPDRARDVLLVGGVPPVLVPAILDALHSSRVVRSTTTWSEGPGRLRGGEMAWIDTPDGVWMLDSDLVSDGNRPVLAFPCSAAAVLDQLLGYLPGASSSY